MIKRYVELGLIPPSAAHTVIEPFCGSGAVSLYLQPQRILLNDTAPPVHWFWYCASTDPARLVDSCKVLYEKDIKNLPVEFAYETAKQNLNSYLDRLSKVSLTSEEIYLFAATFLFVNKHCFNGLWRVNNIGKFNVPYGKYRTLNKWIPSLADLLVLQPRLRTYSKDYADFLSGVDEVPKWNTFTFINPPYYGTYNGYTKGQFSKRDHHKLKETIVKYCKGDVAISSIDCPEMRHLYQDWIIHTIPSKTTIQGQGSSIQNELLITNY